MNWNRKFNYPSLNRSAVNGSRHYIVDQHRLPSVSTILFQTKSDEDKSALVSDGVVVSRTREKTRRGWNMDNGNPVYPSLSFKGLDGRSTTEEMESFRTLYYELLKEHVEVVST